MYWYETFDEFPGPDLEEEEKEQLRQRILTRIRSRVPDLRDMAGHRRHQRIRRHPGRRRWAYGLAAAGVILLGWAVASFVGHRGSSRGSEVLPPASRNNIVLENQSNRVHAILLPDSSRVWLNPSSRLEYPERFIGYDRTVQLEGEAFFDIHKDAAHPFRVKSGKLTTRVLGTRFLVRAFPDKPAEVTVMAGKVSVTASGDSATALILTARQKGVFSQAAGQVARQDVATSVIKRWQQADLSFDNIRLTEVLSALNKKFEVHIDCAEQQIGDYTINADFNKQELTDILEMLEKSLNIHYEIADDSTIRFYGNQDTP